MRLLLDTHVALWAIADHPNLGGKARRLIEDPDNEIYVSAVSVWEIAIKHSRTADGPNGMPISGQQALGYFRDAEFSLLPITPDHTAAVDELPPLHADPFDRLLVAQALSEPLRLLTRDQRIAGYTDLVVLV
jgi:PIN domain nuclease of toxin-antitoxin system